ncbi:hypothetical protein BGX34_004376 [Mortierella sp. NVP85]|nr:hypothetical protein BGX34_004376 [Mortierella sp. NVP85]
MATAAPFESFPPSLLDHPAVLHARDRLRDPIQTAKLHTVHVFDFDQTLFRSPVPNPALWDSSFIGHLVSWNNCGPGWWLNPATLDLGLEAETTAWEGWWNEDLVAKVEQSIKDPGCLTLLLTGRNKQVYGEQLMRIIRGKGLDFDLIATKPGAVALLENPVSGGTNAVHLNGTYVMIHTFSVKHEFLYNILLEYPTIRRMHVWDDRIGQLTKFKQAGEGWLGKNMLESFETTQVNLPLKYMVPDQEISLVTAMVEAHNRQVQLEADGGPFLVAGVGPMPRSRPELEDYRLWDPYETYIPQRRIATELGPVIQYTGIIFSEQVQSFLRGVAQMEQQGQIGIKPPSSLQDQDLRPWELPDDFNISLCMRKAPQDFLETIGGIGANVLVELEAVGELDGKIWALKAAEAKSLENATIVAPNGQIYTCDASGRVDAALGSLLQGRLGRVSSWKAGFPHIVMSYNRFQGMRPYKAAKIRQWEPLVNNGTTLRIVLVGTIGTKQLTGMMTQKRDHFATAPRDEVDILDIVNLFATKEQRQLGVYEVNQMIYQVRQEMRRLSIVNKATNRAHITMVVQAAFEGSLVNQ